MVLVKGSKLAVGFHLILLPLLVASNICLFVLYSGLLAQCGELLVGVTLKTQSFVLFGFFL